MNMVQTVAITKLMNELGTRTIINMCPFRYDRSAIDITVSDGEHFIVWASGSLDSDTIDGASWYQ